MEDKQVTLSLNSGLCQLHRYCLFVCTDDIVVGPALRLEQAAHRQNDPRTNDILWLHLSDAWTSQPFTEQCRILSEFFEHSLCEVRPGQN